MKIYEIEFGSEAWRELHWAFTASGVRIVRIADDKGTFKVKVNEFGWTAPLETKRGQEG